MEIEMMSANFAKTQYLWLGFHLVSLEIHCEIVSVGMCPQRRDPFGSFAVQSVNYCFDVTRISAQDQSIAREICVRCTRNRFAYFEALLDPGSVHIVAHAQRSAQLEATLCSGSTQTQCKLQCSRTEAYEERMGDE